MKISKKKIIVIFIIFTLCILFISQVLTVEAATTIDPKNYSPFSTKRVIGADKLNDIGNKIIGVIQVVGSITSVITLIVLGIKYVTGSVEEKAEYKQTLKPYLIGAIMLFGITNILAIVMDIASF